MICRSRLESVASDIGQEISRRGSRASTTKAKFSISDAGGVFGGSDTPARPRLSMDRTHLSDTWHRGRAFVGSAARTDLSRDPRILLHHPKQKPYSGNGWTTSK